MDPTDTFTEFLTTLLAAEYQRQLADASLRLDILKRTPSLPAVQTAPGTWNAIDRATQPMVLRASGGIAIGGIGTVTRPVPRRVAPTVMEAGPRRYFDE